MRLPWLCLAFVAGLALAQEPADDDDALAQAIAAPIDCAQPASFAPLFELSAADTVEGPDDSEALAQANEAAFLKCPRAFLLSLTAQPRETQDGVLNYFGIPAPRAELGRVLSKWKNDPQVGPIVRTRFAAFLERGEPK